MVVKSNILSLKNLFLIYYAIQYILSPLLYYINPHTFLKLSPESFQYTSYSYFLVIFGGFAFLLGDLMPINLKWKQKPHIINRQLLNFFSLITAIASILMFAKLVDSNGGLYVFLQNQNKFRVSGISGQGIYIFSTLILLPLFMIWICVQSKILNNKLPVLVLSILAIVFLIIGIIIGFRGPLFCFILSFVIYIDAYIRKIRVNILIPMVILGYLLFVLGSATREQSTKNFTIETENWYNIFYRSNGVLILNQTLHHLNTHPNKCKLFDAVKETVTIIIPNATWKNKPFPLNKQYTKEVFSQYNTNISPTILSYIAWVVHPWAILPTMLLLGMFFKVLAQIFKNDGSIISIWYIVTVPFWILLAESPQSSFNQIFMFSVSIFIIYTISKLYNTTIVKKSLPQNIYEL